jgi:hypothetical protein
MKTGRLLDSEEGICPMELVILRWHSMYIYGQETYFEEIVFTTFLAGSNDHLQGFF